MINFDDFDIEETKNTDLKISDDLFVKFLKDHKIYDKFIRNVINWRRNLKTDHRKYGIPDLDKFCEQLDRSSYLSYAFSWDKTPEGFLYWADVNSSWHEILKYHRYDD